MNYKTLGKSILIIIMIFFTFSLIFHRNNTVQQPKKIQDTKKVFVDEDNINVESWISLLLEILWFVIIACLVLFLLSYLNLENKEEASHPIFQHILDNGSSINLIVTVSCLLLVVVSIIVNRKMIIENIKFLYNDIVTYFFE